MKRFAGIYQLQSDGRSFATVPDMLRAMGGERMYQTTQTSARDFCLHEGWSVRMTDELISGALRMNYGQGQHVNAFTMLVSLAGMEDDRLWKVIGGNKQIPINALQTSGAVFHNARVTQVTRQVYDGCKVKYVLEYSDLDSGLTTTQEADAVIAAFPLNSQDPHGMSSSQVRFEGFPTPVYTPATRTPYHNTVATFIRGEINPELFGLRRLDGSFPLAILTTEHFAGAVDFNSVEVQVPCDVADKDVGDFLKPLCKGQARLWKVFTSNHPLTEEQKKVMFRSHDPSVDVAVSWMAYPEYSPPEQFSSFILDDGVFYVNTVEMAASAMEMSAIGAKNTALLAMEHLVKK